MNIWYFFKNGQVPPPQEVPIPTLEIFTELFVKRQEVFEGFMKIEKSRGIMPSVLNLDASTGQDALRLMLFRVIEEICESNMSEEVDHQLEELIDAFNYLTSAFMMGGYFTPERMAQIFGDLLNHPASPPIFGGNRDILKDSDQLYEVIMDMAGRLPDSLRSRSWMNNDQSPYFEGDEIAQRVLTQTLALILDAFEDWAEFYRFFLAKHLVLEFRLNTSY